MNITTKYRMAGISIALFLASAFLLTAHAKADTAAAQATYKAKCAGCHGADGKGKDALKTQDFASSAVQGMSDADLTTIINDGKGKMPGLCQEPEAGSD